MPVRKWKGAGLGQASFVKLWGRRAQDWRHRRL